MVQFFKRKKKLFMLISCHFEFFNILTVTSRSILGPITGTTKINSQSYFERFLRKYIMPSTFRISMSIINFRKLDILFATESLKHIVEKKIKNRIFYNFSLNEISSFDDKKTNTFHERQYDFCLYFRKHPNKNELFFKKFIDDFKVNFPGRKLIIFGDDPEVEENDNIKFLGTVDNKIILNYLNQTKFSIVSDETLFSFFMLDCLSKM